MTTSTETGISTTAPRACQCGTTYQAHNVMGTWLPPHCGCRTVPESVPVTRTPAMLLSELERSGVNVNKYRDATMASFDATHDPDALEAAGAYLEAWRTDTTYPARDWIFFYGADSKGSVAGGVQELGAVGNGKTHLGVAIARRLIEAGKLPPPAYRFVTVERFFLDCEATFRSREDSESRLLDLYARYELLHLDDLGVREPSPHSVRMLDELAKAREGKATIWTSNLSPNLIAQQHPSFKRLVSRLAGECGDGRRYMVAFSGPDRRVMRSKAR